MYNITLNKVIPMKYVENYSLLDEVETFTKHVENRYGLKLAVSVLSNGYPVNMTEYAKVSGYLKRNHKALVKKVCMYDIEDAIILTLNKPGVTRIRDIDGRKKPLLFYRQIFCYLARQYHFTFKSIGKFINRDHATVIHSAKTINTLLEVRDVEVVGIYNAIYSNLELLLSPYIIENEPTTPTSDTIQSVDGRSDVHSSSEKRDRTESNDISI